MFRSRRVGECFEIQDEPESPLCRDQLVTSTIQEGELLWINGTPCNGTLPYAVRFSVVSAVELALDAIVAAPVLGGGRGWTTSLFYGSMSDASMLLGVRR